MVRWEQGRVRSCPVGWEVQLWSMRSGARGQVRCCRAHCQVRLMWCWAKRSGEVKVEQSKWSGDMIVGTRGQMRSGEVDVW